MKMFNPRGKNPPKKTEQETIVQSVRDLTRIERPKPEQVPAFIRGFIAKYKVPGGYQKSLERIAREVLDNG